MIDSFNRKITYLRVSVTQDCNLRCRYCMPLEGITCCDTLSEDEIIDAISVAADMGVTKIRITGGEPLVRKNIVSICDRINKINGIEKIGITTNGILLSKLAFDLKRAGVEYANISLDTMSSEKYHYITRWGKIEDVFSGIEAVLSAGFKRVKINTVLMGGFNDNEIQELAELTYKYPIDVRFIELMPMYDSKDFDANIMIPSDKVLEVLPNLEELTLDGVARLYKLPNALGNIGLISPVSSHFCASCNRLRLTADGKIKPCLHSPKEYSIKGLNREQMRAVFEESVFKKPKAHDILSAVNRSKSGRNMNEIGG